MAAAAIAPPGTQRPAKTAPFKSKQPSSTMNRDRSAFRRPASRLIPISSEFTGPKDSDWSATLQRDGRRSRTGARTYQRPGYIAGTHQTRRVKDEHHL